MKQGSNSRRSRGRGNGKRPQKNHNFDSAGPEGRVRGNAQQVYEKYLALARDAMSAGDRIATENYFQHAEHYLRVLMAQDNSDGRVDAFRQRQRFGPFGADEFDEQDGGDGDDDNAPAENREPQNDERPQGERRNEGSDMPREASDRETTGRQNGEGGGRREGSGNGRRVPIERSNDAGRGEAKAAEKSDDDSDDEGLRRTLAL